MPSTHALCRFLPTLVFVLAPSDAAVYAQGGAAAFQTFIASPRSQALGEATVALRGYPGAAQINPATIGRSGLLQGMTLFNLAPHAPFRTRWSPVGEPLRGARIASTSLDARSGRWAAAYTYKKWSRGTVEYRNAQGIPTRGSRGYDDAHKLSVARDLSPSTAVGAGLSLIRSNGTGMGSDGNEETQPGRSPRTLALDLGVQFERAFTIPGLNVKSSLGLSLLDFGGRLHDLEDGPGEPVSTMLRGGAGLRFSTFSTLLGRPTLEVGLFGQLSKEMNHFRVDSSRGRIVFRADNALKALFTSWQPQWYINSREFSPVLRRRGTWDQLRRHAGLELSLARIAFLRLGCVGVPDYVSRRQYVTLGWGLDLYYVSLDYSRAAEDLRNSGGLSYWTLTARLPIGPAQDNFWPELLRKLRD